MTWAETLVGPASWLMLIAVPMSGILSAFGGKGVRAALIVLASLFAINLTIANNLSRDFEYGEAIVMIAFVATFFSCLPILFGWHIGNFIRERRSSPRKA